MSQGFNVRTTGTPVTNTDIDYYAILGLQPGADAASIRATYRRLMQQDGHHPDRGGDAKTAALINKAYAILSDPEQRTDYDLRMDVLARVSEGLTITQARRVLNPERECLFCERPHNFGGGELADMSCGHCGSALQSVEHQRLAPCGQRAMLRVGKSVDMQVYTSVHQRRGHTARTEDVSPLGLRLTTTLNLFPGQRLRIVSDILDAVGEVTHCAREESLWRPQTVAGISFLTLRFARPAGAFVSAQA